MPGASKSTNKKGNYIIDEEGNDVYIGEGQYFFGEESDVVRTPLEFRG